MKLKYNPRILDRSLRNSVERWWNYALLLKVVIFGIGISTIFVSTFSQYVSLVVAILVVLSEASVWYSNSLRDKWEDLHRELDEWEGFGWPISRSKISDLLTERPKGFDDMSKGEKNEPYFASLDKPGPRKAVENTLESSWWAKHIAKRAGDFYTYIVIFLVTASIVVLIISIESIKNLNMLSNIGKVVISTLLLIFTLDLFRVSRAYHIYSQKAAWIEKQAEILLDTQNVDLVHAIRLLKDYHLAHAESPLNPNWIWKSMQSNLNRLWIEYRQERFQRANLRSTVSNKSIQNEKRRNKS